MTGREAKGMLVRALEKCSDSPDFEAAELLCAATHLKKNEWIIRPENSLSKSEEKTLQRWVKRRQKGEPLQYILGEWEFYSLPLSVGKGVLIPRADSELLVDLALEELGALTSATVLDLCAGSGAIGIAVSHHFPQASVFLVEKSGRAFSYLKKNIARNKVSALPVRADIFRYQPPQKVDLILCNPPYIEKGEKKSLSREVKKEPALALFGGRDGMKFYRFLSLAAPRWLKKNGKLLLEIGWTQAEAVASLLQQAGFTSVEVFDDLAGRPRAISAVWPFS